MRIFVVYIFACLSCFFSACSEKTQVREVIKLSRYDSITISIDYPILSDYVTLKSYSMNGEDYIMGYNHFNHSLDFISLSGKDHLSVELQAEGPDAVLKGIKFCQLMDKILCLDSSGLLVLDKDGKVVERMSMTEVLAPEGKYRIRPKGLSYGNFMPFCSFENEGFIPTFPMMDDKGVKIGKVYNAVNHTIEELPMEFPDEIREHINLLGGLAMPQITAYEDRILYNFPSSSLVYFYSRENGRTEIVKMESCSVDNIFDLEKRKENNNLKESFIGEVTTHRFNEVYFCTETKAYYRIHYGAKTSMGDKNRSIYLMVCDEDSETVREYLLPSSFREQYVVVDDQILFLLKDSNDSILYFAKIDVRNL